MLSADCIFDYVYARLVLHNLNKQQLSDALNEIYRVLKPNGKLFIVARNNKQWQLKKHEFVISYDEETNITTYYSQLEKRKLKKDNFCLNNNLKMF